MEHKKELKQFKRKENQLVKELLTTINENNIRTFKGNPLLKKADEKVEMTRAHVREFKKCMNDPVYFAERYIKIVHVDKGLIPIELYDYQKRILKALKEHRFNILLSCRQSGKTTLVVCFLVWYVIFHADKACAVLANKGSTARQIVGRIELAYQNLPKFLQQGVVAWNMGSFSLENGSSICSASTTSDSVRGSSFSCVAEDTLVTIVDDDDNVWNIPINKVDQIQKVGSMKQYHREKKYYYVYRIINKINNKEYIGFHSTNNMNDGYMGSGKLIIKAIEKYGIENFEKEILKQFNNKKDAELYERELVNEEYVKRNDTYNISIGGNVCILCGEQNGFYGKKHKPETIAKIVKANKERYLRGEMHHPETLKTTPMRIGNHIFDSYNHAKKVLGLTPMNINYYLYADKNCYMLNEEDQQKACQIYKEYAKNKIIRHQKHVENMRKANQRPERNAKLSASLVGKKHPWNIKINTNPEKIAKTAAKHRGMKRSAETCRKISEALKAKNRKQAESKTHESIN